jgi:hypothetical protein
MKKAIIFIMVAFSSLPSAFASLSGGAFLKIDPSPRSYALGKSQSVASMGAEALAGNPANLMAMDRHYEVFSAFSSVMEGVTYGHIAGVVNRSTTRDNWVDALGFSVTRLSVGGMEGRDKSGNKTADFQSQDTVTSVSLSGNVTRRLNLGFTGKMITAEIAGYKAQMSVAGDLGMSYKFKGFGKDMILGASLNNMGQGLKFVNQSDPLPTAMNVGLGTDVGPFSLVGGMSQLINDRKLDMSAGVEYKLGVMALRAGYNGGGSSAGSAVSKSESGNAMLSGLTTGVGFKVGSLKLDYALGGQNSELGMSHRVSLTMEFGRKAQ